MNFKKISALILSLAFLASCSSPLSPESKAMQIGKNTVFMDEYAYYYNYTTGIYLESIGKTVEDSLSKEELAIISEQASKQVTFSVALKDIIKENNLSLTSKDLQMFEFRRAEEIKQYGSEEELSKALLESGMTLSAYDELSKSAILYNKLSELKFGDNGTDTLTEKDALEYFKTDFFRVKHILREITPDGHSIDDEHGHPSNEEQKKLAIEIKEKLDNGGNFDALIKEYGEDPGMLENADGYHFSKGQTDPAFEKASLALADNETSDVVESSFGYHIINKLPLDMKFYDDNKDEILINLRDDAMNKLIEEKIETYSINIESSVDKINPSNVSEYFAK